MKNRYENHLKSKIIFEALTFDDVLLVPDYSEVLPREVSVKSKLTKKISLNVPLVSAAMDTVTEFQMAISMALEGGIGFIHKNMTIQKQADQVRRVKRSQSGMILDPIVLNENAKVKDALHIMKENRIGGIPIVNEQRYLVGIVTNRDLRFQSNGEKSIKKVMTSEKIITAQEGVTLAEAQDVLQQHKIEKLPIVNKKNLLCGLVTYRDILKNRDKPLACKDQYGRLCVGAAIGVSSDISERVEALVNAGVDVVSIDTAHGHHNNVISVAAEIKNEFPDLELIVGNIATAEAAELIIKKANVDGLKVGIGPGSICTTRVVAGVGVPQFSAINEVSLVAQKYGVPIISDGGIRFSGDIVKAIAAGGNTVMIGSLLAGTDEAPGQVVLFEGRKFKTYRGMGSLEAMEYGSKDRYFQEAEDDVKKLVPEGIMGRVPYKGFVSEVIFQLVGGLKAGMGYSGSKNISTLQNAKFVKITQAGKVESHPHDVVITREAPNYTIK